MAIPIKGAVQGVAINTENTPVKKELKCRALTERRTIGSVKGFCTFIKSRNMNKIRIKIARSTDTKTGDCI